MFNMGVGLDLRNEPQWSAQIQPAETERMSAIGGMICSLSHDMRHSLSAIYANAEFLERHDLCANERAALVFEIQEAVLEITERLESVLQFVTGGRKNQIVRGHVSLVVEEAVAAVKFHPDGRNVLITVGQLPPVEADIDAKNLESAIYNLLLNACQAASCSVGVPEVQIHLAEADERIYVTILDNDPGIPASVRGTLFDPIVTAGKPKGTGLGLTLARRIRHAYLAVDFFFGLSGFVVAYAHDDRWTKLLAYVTSLLLLPSPPVGGRPEETQALNGPAWSLMQEYLGNIASL